jgi:AraC-like DNA-binding protein
MEILVRSVTLNGFVSVARSVGLDPHALIQETGLDPTALVDSDLRIRVSAACQLFQLAAERGHCPSFGLQLAIHRQGLDFGLLGVLMAHKRSLREMWMTAIHYRYLANDALSIGLEVDGDVATLRYELMVDASAPVVQSVELAAGVIVRSCQAVLGPHWRPRSVSFMHAPPADLGWHRQLFGCPVRFHSDLNAIVLSTADLDAPNPGADIELVRYAESLARPLNASATDRAAAEVRQAIFLLLPMESGATIERVATHLHMSVRSVQRRLETSGTDFSALLDDVRRDLALRYMRNPDYTVGRVSSLLGYTHQASFTRWFTAHFGAPPKAWRATQGRNA